MEKNLKNFKRQLAQNGVFYTPLEDAKKLTKFIDIEFSEVYDPTCGQGNLLAVFDDSVRKYGQELDAAELQKAAETLVNFEGFAGDTLSNDGFAGRKFELIIANPPFSVKWEPNAEDERFSVCPALAPKSKADWAFNLHIIHHLKEDGQAIVLNFPGTAYRGNSEKKIRQWVIENNLIDKVIAYPPNTFVDTNIATIVYIFKKNRQTTDVIFVDDDGIEKTVTQEEIIAQDFNLSVSCYIEKETVREVVDINKLNQQIADSLLNAVKEFLRYGQLEEYLGDMKVDYFKKELRKIVDEMEE